MATLDTVDVPDRSSREGTAMGRVAVIGGVGGYVAHLRHALAQLGVTDSKPSAVSPSAERVAPCNPVRSPSSGDGTVTA